MLCVRRVDITFVLVIDEIHIQLFDGEKKTQISQNARENKVLSKQTAYHFHLNVESLHSIEINCS